MARSKERCQELMDILERTSMRPKGAKPPEYPQEYKDYRTLCTEEVVKRFPEMFHGFIPHLMGQWKEAADLIVRTVRVEA